MSNRRPVAADGESSRRQEAGRAPTDPLLSGSTDRLGTLPALFIYIPTYNRPAKLRQQLDALTSQRSDWPGTLRILVNDNSSPSFSAEAAAAMEREFGIEVRINLGNVQANANIALAFVFGRPEEYLWILSDDDIVREGALRTIATEGFLGDPDVVTFATTSRRATTIVHTWHEGWDWIGENGLISNVIFKAGVLAPQASQAFFYHNSSFPHLAVLMATMRERGTLRFRVVPSAWVLHPPEHHREEGGDYSLSLSGMPQLAALLPHDDAARFCRLWLREQGRGYVRYQDRHPDIHLATRAVLKKYGGRRAMILLRWFMLTQPISARFQRGSTGRLTRLLPEPIRRRLRTYL